MITVRMGVRPGAVGVRAVSADGAVNVFVPQHAVPGLVLPPLAITDGSAGPVWVELPCRGGYAYGRKRTLRLPLDAATAEVARGWLRFERRQLTVWTPVILTLLTTAGAMVLFVEDARLDWVRRVVFAAGLLLQLWVVHVEKKVTVAQHPELIGRLGIYLPAVSTAVAWEWAQRNPAVQVVSERPQWRRYPALVYRLAAGSCAVAGAGVWWFALRDGEFELSMVLALVVLLGAAAVLAFKALPVGFVRFGDAPGPR